MNKYISLDILIDNLDWDNDLQKWTLRGDPEDLVAVDVAEVKHGHWISWGRKLKCSNCEHRVYLGTYDLGVHEEESKNRLYCSHCGARMDEVEGDKHV